MTDSIFPIKAAFKKLTANFVTGEVFSTNPESEARAKRWNGYTTDLIKETSAYAATLSDASRKSAPLMPTVDARRTPTYDAFPWGVNQEGTLVMMNLKRNNALAFYRIPRVFYPLMAAVTCFMAHPIQQHTAGDDIRNAYSPLVWDAINSSVESDLDAKAFLELLVEAHSFYLESKKNA